MNLDSLPDILKVSEVSEVLRCSEIYVRRLCRTGKLPARKVGRGWRVTKSALQAFVTDTNKGEKVVP